MAVGELLVGGLLPVNELTAGLQDDPTVAHLPDGRFVVVWQSSAPSADGDGSVIRARLFNADGSPAGSEFLVNDVPAGEQISPEVAVLSDGRFVISWKNSASATATSNGVSARIFDANGAPEGGSIQLTTDVLFLSKVTLVATPDGGFAAVWASQVDTFPFPFPFPETRLNTQLFDASGNAVGAVTQFTVGLGGFDYNDIAVTSLADGRLVIAASAQGVGSLAYLTDAAGHITASFGYDDIGLGSRSIDIAALAGGGFVVQWDTGSGSPTDGGSRFRLFDSTGAALGASQPVSAATSIFSGQLVATADGGFAISHTTYDGTSLGFQLIQYDGTGSQTGDPVVGNQLNSGALSVSASGAFVTVWSGTGNVFDADTRGIAAGIIATDAVPNVGPTITSNDGAAEVLLFVPENGLAVTMLTATDPEGNPISYAIVGGIDADKFVIDPNTGVLSFAQNPDYENPGSTNGANDYFVVVAAHDGTAGDQQALHIIVNDVLERTVINGSHRGDVIDGTHTVAGQPFASDGADEIYGNGGEDLIRGLGGSDLIDGGTGEDRLFGGDGDDILMGGRGDDWLVGGADFDTLTGGSGRDIFDFQQLSDAYYDRITDFSRGDGDQISLSGIDANLLRARDQAFNFIGTNEFSGVAGQLRYYHDQGSTWITGDVNGDGYGDFWIQHDGMLQLSSRDFIL